MTGLWLTNNICYPSCLVPGSRKLWVTTERSQSPNNPCDAKDPAKSKQDPVTPVPILFILDLLGSCCCWRVVVGEPWYLTSLHSSVHGRSAQALYIYIYMCVCGQSKDNPCVTCFAARFHHYCSAEVCVPRFYRWVVQNHFCMCATNQVYLPVDIKYMAAHAHEQVQAQG